VRRGGGEYHLTITTVYNNTVRIRVRTFVALFFCVRAISDSISLMRSMTPILNDD
jgi:hypothetical protein